MKTVFSIQGMRCAGCQAHIEKDVRKLEGLISLEINLATNKMTAEYDENRLSADTIAATVKKAGYGATADGADGEKKKNFLSKLFGRS